MDKNYSVDDILRDIKNKKMQKMRDGQDGGQAAPPVRQQEQFPGRGAGGRNGVAFASGPFEDDDSLPDRDFMEPHDQPVQEPRQPRTKTRRPADDNESDSPFREDMAEPDYGGEHEPPDWEKPRNPLDFEGRVRPLTDRAKIRRSKGLGVPKKERKQASVIDFSRFRSRGPRLGAGPEDTQVVPRLGASRELDMEEIRNMDFGELEDDFYEDDYEDDYQSGETHKPAMSYDEYTSVKDRRDVAIDIARTKLWLVVRTGLTLALTVCLAYLVLCGRYLLPMPPAIAPENDGLGMYLLSITVLTVLVALVGSSTMGGGLIGLFKMRSNSDTLVALAVLGAVGQCVFALTNPELINIEALTLYSALAAASMFFNALGKLRMISRIQANFKIISSDRQKKAVLLATDESFTREYLKGATRRPSIAYAAKCDFFTDFLALSYSDKYDVGINKAVAPVCLLGAGVVGVLTYILTRGSTMTAVTAVVAILCGCATFSATFIENVPLGKLTRKLAPRGGMVSGNKAVEDFCDVSAIVLDEKDLFPFGHTEVHGIKTYSQGRVDEAILDAASIAYDMNSALSDVFLKMIGGNKKLLRKVDSAVFENGRGITAWIDGRRVMLGNRKLMQSHGIMLPQPGFEQKYADEQGEPLFLASAGELSAQLVVGYRVDEELALELDKLGAMQKLLIVRTVDANLTPHKIWELYGYPEEFVQIMPAEQHGQYEKMTAPRPSELAELAYTGRASAMVGCILACVSARASILSATTVQLIQIALGYGLIALLAFLGLIDTLTMIVLGGYQLFWLVVTGLVQRIRAV